MPKLKSSTAIRKSACATTERADDANGDSVPPPLPPPPPPPSLIPPPPTPTTLAAIGLLTSPSYLAMPETQRTRAFSAAMAGRTTGEGEGQGRQRSTTTAGGAKAQTQSAKKKTKKTTKATTRATGKRRRTDTAPSDSETPAPATAKKKPRQRKRSPAAAEENAANDASSSAADPPPAKGPNRHEVKWQSMLGELKQFHAEHGHAKVPNSENGPYRPLRIWANRQRKAYKAYKAGTKTTMTEERAQALIGLEFPWGKPLADKWRERFEELRLFKEKHGHTRVPKSSGKSSSSPNEYQKLWHWTRDQKEYYSLNKRGKKSSLTPERVEALESIGFEWRGHLHRGFATFLGALKEFKAEHGHCNVPQRRNCADPSLGYWVDTQRRQYKALMAGKKSTMTPERIKSLADVGFQWTLKADRGEAWESNFSELRQFAAAKGDCDIPCRYRPNPALGRWAENMRRDRRLLNAGKKCPLTDEKIARLDSIGFNWGKERFDND